MERTITHTLARQRRNLEIPADDQRGMPKPPKPACDGLEALMPVHDPKMTSDLASIRTSRRQQIDRENEARLRAFAERMANRD